MHRCLRAYQFNALLINDCENAFCAKQQQHPAPCFRRPDILRIWRFHSAFTNFFAVFSASGSDKAHPHLILLSGCTTRYVLGHPLSVISVFSWVRTVLLTTPLVRGYVQYKEEKSNGHVSGWLPGLNWRKMHRMPVFIGRNGLTTYCSREQQMVSV